MRHNSFFSSAQARRLPLASKHRPLDRPHGCRKVLSLPSVLHFRMRSLGWSVKKTLPSASAAGPSVKAKSPASFSNLAPGAIRLLFSPWAAGTHAATTRAVHHTVARVMLAPSRVDVVG